MKINYSYHDDAYKRLKKEEGIIGWDKTLAAYEEIERRLKSIFDLCKMPFWWPFAGTGMWSGECFRSV